MKREVVREFLNLPGIVGVAMMDGRSRPFFFGIDQALNSQQKDALVQGIQHVIETTPSDFDSFEFQFIGHQLCIYKLDQGIVLLVLAQDDVVQEDYQRAIGRIKTSLQTDMNRAIATFRLLASEISFSSQSMRRFPSTTLSSQTNADRTYGGQTNSGQTNSGRTNSGRTNAGSSMPAPASESSVRASAQNGMAASNPALKKSQLPDRQAAPGQGQTPQAKIPQAKTPQAKTSDSVRKTPQPDRQPSSPSAPSSDPQASTTRKVIEPPGQQPHPSQRVAPPDPKAPDQSAGKAATNTQSNRTQSNRTQSNRTQATNTQSNRTQATKTQPGATNRATNNQPVSPSTPTPALGEATSGQVAPPEATKPAELAEMVLALNALSKFTAQYLGAAVITNYWKSSRSDLPWLDQFEIDRAAQISMVGNMASSAILSTEQYEAIQSWVKAFIDRCSRVIRDFRKLVIHSDLSDRQKSLLLSSTDE